MCTISRPWRDVDFTIILTQEKVFIDRFYCTKHTETYNFHVPTLVVSTLHKSQQKSVSLCPNSLLLTKKQLYAIHFFLATYNVFPLVIPEPFEHNMGIRLLVNHPLCKLTGFRINFFKDDFSVYYFVFVCS